PFIAALAANLEVDGADRHRPTVGAQHPALHELGLAEGVEYQVARCIEGADDHDLAVALGLQGHVTHLRDPLRVGMRLARSAFISSSRPSRRWKRASKIARWCS